jgi:hypothetical protein
MQPVSPLDMLGLDRNKIETLDGARPWRQCGAMDSDSKTASIRTLDRINLLLPAETFEAIDDCRSDRPGAISRNTWITEAVEEKLARDRAENTHREDRRRNG